MRRKQFSRTIGQLCAVMAVMLLLGSSVGAATYKTLHVFKGSDGSSPFSGLTFDTVGNLYGTAPSGGAYGYGVVFKLAPNPKGTWKESVLYNFTGGADGGDPNSSLIFDSSGNLYGVSGCCGTYGAGNVFELTPNPDGSWNETVLYEFTGGFDGLWPAGPLIFDTTGTLYGTALWGGIGCGVVFKLTPNSDGTWTESVTYSFNDSPDLCHPQGSLVFDASGNLYGTGYWGGSTKCVIHGCGGVFELTPNPDGSWTESVLHRFSGGWDGANPQGVLTLDTHGNLFGDAVNGTYDQSCGNNRCGTIFELTPRPDGTWKTHIAHMFTGGSDGGNPDSGPVLDAAGSLYGTAGTGGRFGYGLVFKLTPKPTRGWKETVLHVFADHPGAIPQGGVIFDAAGNLYGTTSGDGATTFGSVYEITP